MDNQTDTFIYFNMRIYCNRLLDEYLYINCRKNFKVLIILAAVFITGLIFGLFLGGKGLYSEDIFSDSINFTILIFTGKITFFQIVFRSFFINLQYFIIVFIFSLSIYLLPLNFVFVSYKGYVFGAAVIVFTNAMGLHGFSNLLILVLPQQFILLFCISLYISYSCRNSACIKYKCFDGIAAQTKHCLVFFVLSLSDIIVQILLIYVIIKPFNILI